MQNTLNPGKRFFLRSFLFIAGLCLAMLCLAGIALAMFWAPDQPVDDLKARWAPSPSQFINVRGMSVHVRDEGRRDDPVPIVLIHGTSASLHTWEGWVAELKNQHRVISMDIPAFGLTGPRADADYHSTTYARFMLDLLDTMQVSRCIIAGNSLGGEVAWMVAATAPQRVERLILVDAGGYAFKADSIPLGFRIARMPQLAWIGEHVLPRHMMETSVKNVYGNPDRVTSALVDRYTAMTLREGNRHALGQRFQQTSSGAHAADIKGIHVPTLIIWGGQDRLIPSEYAKKFNQDIAGSKLVIFDKLGHVPHEEDPVATVAVVKDFLKM